MQKKFGHRCWRCIPGWARKLQALSFAPISTPPPATLTLLHAAQLGKVRRMSWSDQEMIAKFPVCCSDHSEVERSVNNQTNLQHHRLHCSCRRRRSFLVAVSSEMTPRSHKTGAKARLFPQ